MTKIEMQQAAIANLRARVARYSDNASVVAHLLMEVKKATEKVEEANELYELAKATEAEISEIKQMKAATKRAKKTVREIRNDLKLARLRPHSEQEIKRAKERLQTAERELERLKAEEVRQLAGRPAPAKREERRGLRQSPFAGLYAATTHLPSSLDKDEERIAAK